MCVVVSESYNARHDSIESEDLLKKELATHNNGQYLTSDFHVVLPSPLPPPFNVDLACVLDHVELKHEASRCQH